MFKENDVYRDYLNIISWHKAGYTGSRTVVATGETVYKSKLIDDYAYENLAPSGDGTEHGTKTAKVFWEIAPDAKLISVQSSLVSKDFKDYSIPVIKEKNVSVLWESLSSGNVKEFNDPELEKISDFCSHFMAIGNDGEEKYNTKSKEQYTYAVGAVMLTANGKVIPESWSSVSEYIDVVSFDRIKIDYNNNGFLAEFTGTSCATPVLGGMCALVNDFFIDKTGSPLSSKMMIQFIYDNCTDIWYDGFDTKTGFGLFILPDINTIDISKYTTNTIKGVLDMFEDKDLISDWAEESVAYCVEKGYIKGDGTNFYPQDNLTREELCVIIHRMETSEV